MKKYQELDVEILLVNMQDVVTTSPGFIGNEDDDGFGDPNAPGAFSID